MQRLGLDNKLNEELQQKIARLEEANAELERQHAQDQAKLKKANEKIEKLSQAIETDVIAQVIGEYCKEQCDLLKQIISKMESDGYSELAAFFMKKIKEKDQVLSEILRKLNFLSLSSTKKSEIQKRTDENGLSEGQTIDETDPTIKHPKVEDAKARGNNGAKHDPHDEVPYEDNVIEVFPNEYNPNYPDRFQIVERRRHTRFTLVQAYIKKQCYDVVKIYDRQQKRFLPMPKIPGTVLKGSKYSVSQVADMFVKKYGWHITVTIIAKQYHNMGFNINEGTINGIISKVAGSLFFRNMDTVLNITILHEFYALIDETFSKARTDYAKLDGEFIKECWLWAMYAVDLKLIRFSCDDQGSRSDEVGYNLIEPVDHHMIIQSDGKSCYRQFEQRNVHIERISCLQHQKRKFINLKDPRAKNILALFSEMYHLDHVRCNLAKEEALAGKQWSKEDHIQWRIENILPVYEHIITLVHETLDEAPVMDDNGSITNAATVTNVQPLSKEFRNALNYVLNEEGATRKIFTCGELVLFDTNLLEIQNRSYSYHRRTSEAFGSLRAAKDQAIFISLMTSAKLHDINLNEYMSFLLEQMSIVEDCVIENEKSKNFELFRNMLPDRYAEMHKNDKKPYYPPPEVDSGPLNPNSKRCGYKKHRVPEPSPNPEVG